MFTDTRARTVSGSVPRMAPMKVSALAAVLMGAFILVGCDGSGASEPDREIAAIAISPDSASIGVGARVDFSVAALTATGDTVRDADLDIEWWSTNAEVFTVAPGGVATGRAPGAAYCVVEATEEVAEKARFRLRFTGRDSAFVRIVF